MNTEKLSKIHLGRRLKQVIYEKHIGAYKLAEMLGKGNAVIFQMLNRQHFSTKLLLHLSATLDHNFFHYLCPDLQEEIKTLTDENAKLKQSIAQLEQKAEVMKEMVSVLGGKKV